MAARRPSVVYACVECGHESAKWAGRCPGCQAWNTLVEEVRTEAAGNGQVRRPSTGARRIADIATELPSRTATGLGELDRVLGGGVVPGSAVLIGGDPGIGKSTLLLQAASALAASLGGPVLYVSAEESEDQVRLRASRLGASGARDLFLLSDTSLESVVGECERLRARAIVADSVQTLWSERLPAAPGSVGQVREVAARLLAVAKTSGSVVFLVGHVTKDGTIAGPRTLEHMVDTVLYFEGDRGRAHRVLRATKNRFGPSGEIGVFEMSTGGLRGVENASAELLAERNANVPGSAVLASVEGSRSLLVEVQALVAEVAGGAPRRTANGFDPNRLLVLLAVLERRAGIDARGRDLFVSVVGGLELGEPAADLAVAVAAASATLDAAVDPDLVLFGEVGLAGELRAVARADLRLAEAERLGFRRAVVPVGNVPGRGPEASAAPAGRGASAARVPGRAGSSDGIEVVGVTTVREALDQVLRYPSSRRT